MLSSRAADYDVLIVGARLAGSALAALLGDAGYTVLLADRATFPSPTLSTHFFRGGRAGAVLQRLGVLDDVLALGCPPLVREFRFHANQCAPTINPPQSPGGLGYGLSVRREPLDHILLHRATHSATVDLLEDTTVSELVWAERRVVGARLRTPDGPRLVRAQCVVGADGRGSFVARAVRAPLQTTEAAHRGFYYCYVRDWVGPEGGAPDAAEFHHLGDECAYVFPSDSGLACVALTLNLATYAWVRQAPAERFYERLAAHPGLVERLLAARRVSGLFGCGPTSNYVRVPVGAGWALVGDAGLHQDPWSGLGIDQALLQATFLAEALGAWFGGAELEQDALAAYHRRRDADALAGYQRTVSLSRNLGEAQQPAAPRA
jgi:2-polyprenyl-6-methoxyphenol hydroxylase-like FAD-dependent oxidoreductase